MNLKKADRYRRLSRFAISHLKELVEGYNINCDWIEPGRYHAAASRQGVEHVLRPYAQMLDRLNEPYSWVEAAELRKCLGTSSYKAAVFTPGGALLNPAALVCGLANALPINVSLYEKSPVLRADFSSEIILETKGGSIRAKRFILAANGFAEQFGFFTGRFLHLSVLASLTSPIKRSADLPSEANQSWGLTPANAMVGATLRLLSDGRFLIRQVVCISLQMQGRPSDLRSIRLRHQASLIKRFPCVPNIHIENTWGGMICLSRNGAPGFGQVAPNIWSAVCHNGSGITKGTYGGILVADLATRRDSPLIADLESLGEPSQLPHPALTRLGAHVRFQIERWRSRKEI